MEGEGKKDVVAPRIELINKVIQLAEHSRLPQDKLRCMEVLLQNINQQFRPEPESMPNTIEQRLEELDRSLAAAKRLMNSAQRQKKCPAAFLRKSSLSRELGEWTRNFHQLFNNLLRDCHPQLPEASFEPELLQPVPESGFVGSGFKSAEKKLNTWSNAEDIQFRVISVYGMVGSGKTSLLKTVHNSYKKGNVFEAVIWITVLKKYNILDLQSIIADKINLNLGSSSTAQTRKVLLSLFLKGMKFLLILDYLRSPFDLGEVGIPSDNYRGSKVVISTPSIDEIRTLETSKYSIPMERLLPEEGWQLFCRVAFKAGGTPPENMKNVAGDIARKCGGSPLAINVVAATMARNTSVNEWDLALLQMEDWGTAYHYDEVDLIKSVKWSYDHLPDYKSKICFLYGVGFPEDEEINVETLVEMWIGEGLVNSGKTSYFTDAGLWYVKLLVERCFFENIGKDMMYIKTQAVLRNMAMSMNKLENCLFSYTTQNFPTGKELDNCKRIAVNFDNTPFLPTDFKCPELVTLFLSRNRSLREVPNDFLLNLPSLRVVDLSNTKIESLPISICQLTRVEFLKLSDTLIKDLPEDICNISGLQFLHLDSCKELESLPSKIEGFTNLKHLNLDACEKLRSIPLGISRLSSLMKLQLIIEVDEVLNVQKAQSGVCKLKDLTNFQNLMELSLVVKPGIQVDGIRSGIKAGIMGTWLKMRKLTLIFNLLDLDVDEDDDILVEDLPCDLQKMKELQIFNIADYRGTGLPNSICDLEQLEKLELHGCYQLRELPLLERLANLRSLSLINCFKLLELRIGTGESVAGFPMLESLYLEGLPMLTSMTDLSSNVVWEERTMPKLQVLTIIHCKSLKTLPVGIHNLPNLREVRAYEYWWAALIWKDRVAQKLLKDKLKRLC